MYRNSFCRRHGWNRNVHVFVGTVRRNRAERNRTVRGKLYSDRIIASRLYANAIIYNYAASCHFIDSDANQRCLLRSMYRHGICSSNRGNRNLHVRMGSVRWYGIKCNRTLRRNLYLHGFFTGWLYTNSDIHHYAATCNNIDSVTNQRSV